MDYLPFLCVNWLDFNLNNGELTDWFCCNVNMLQWASTQRTRPGADPVPSKPYFLTIAQRDLELNDVNCQKRKTTAP